MTKTGKIFALDFKKTRLPNTITENTNYLKDLITFLYHVSFFQKDTCALSLKINFIRD
jgi:hypothetical protein